MKILKNQNPNSQHLKYLQILEEDDDFGRFLKHHRKRLRLPIEGLPLNKNSYKDVLERDNVFLDNLVQSAHSFTIIYDLPLAWIDTALFLILFDVAFSPNKTLYKPIKIVSEHHSYNNEVRLVIKEGVSVTALKKYIDKNSKELNRMLSNLPKEQTVKMENIEIKKFIRKKHLEGKKDSEIDDEIKKEYGIDLPLTTDYRTIQITRKRFETTLKKLIGIRGLRAILVDFP